MNEIFTKYRRDNHYDIEQPCPRISAMNFVDNDK